MANKPRVEVLVATMHQIDESLYNRMNLQTGAVIANQCDRNEYKEYFVNGTNIKMISTADRGVGKNRNLALLNSNADIILFADDDMIYEDNYEKGVIEAFKQLPDADIIIFEIESLNKKIPDRPLNSIGRVRIHNFMRYGTARIGCRRDRIIKANIWFSLLFGGGAAYSSGEDTLFLREALRKGLKIYKHPFKIAKVKHESSTWFSGFNEKYFNDKGVLLNNAFPKSKYLIIFLLALKFRMRVKGFGLYKILKLMYGGIINYKEDFSI